MKATGDVSIYRQVLQDGFEALAPELKTFHDVRGVARFRGRCRIEGAERAAGRFVARLAGMPDATPGAEFEFELRASAERESWTRLFPGRVMRSTLRAAAGRLVERIGPLSFWFSLNVADRELDIILARVTLLGVPLPRALMPQVWGREKADEGMLHFDVSIRLPLVGLITAYSGYLSVAHRAPARAQAAPSPCVSS